MPRSYYVIKWKDETILTTTSKKIMESAKKLDSVKSIILRQLTENGWKETIIK